MNITNTTITNYINEFYKPLTKELGYLRIKGEEDNIPIILKETEVFLKSLIDIHKPSKILEIGTAIAYSSIFFANLDGIETIDTIEYNEKNYSISKENIMKFKLSKKIKVHLGDGEDVINQLYENKDNKYEFVFIDASKSHYKRFFDAALKVSKKGTIIVCDNVLMRGMTASSEYDLHNKHKTNIRKMREFLEYIYSLNDLHTSIYSIGDGITISIKK